MDTTVREWRITVKSDDGGELRYEEPFSGTEFEARKRAWVMWARSSYVVNGRSNRDVYMSLEVLDPVSQRYRMVKEKRGKYPAGAIAPGQSW
jgi:hypothetical protein